MAEIILEHNDIVDITNGKVGDCILRSGKQWLSSFALCPLCSRVGAYCEDTGYWYHVIVMLGYNMPFICDRCEPETGRRVISQLAESISGMVAYPFESKSE